MRFEQGVAAGRPIALAEFIETADRLWDPNKPESVWELRGPLSALARNREDLFSAMRDLAASVLADPHRSTGPSYFIIHSGDSYSIRMTTWFPEHDNPEIRNMENILFAYDYPHNHNFDLLTTTCFGPGYETDLFEIAPPEWGLMNGETVAARSLGRVHLSPGSVLLYQACSDVHSQVPVAELSVALNFLPYSPKVLSEPQYAFAVLSEEQLAVIGSPQDFGTRELHGARILAKLVASGLALRPEVTNILEGRPASLLSDYLGSLVSLDPAALRRRLRDELESGQYATQYGEASARMRRWRTRMAA